MIRRFRIALIQFGKVAPFVLCLIVGVSYTENVFSLYTDSFMEFDDGIYLYKPISWAIGNYFEYSIFHLSAILLLSVAIETCIYNKLACVYLAVNLFEKSCLDFELEPTAIYLICIANIVVAGYLTYEGIKMLIRHE